MYSYSSRVPFTSDSVCVALLSSRADGVLRHSRARVTTVRENARAVGPAILSCARRSHWS